MCKKISVVIPARNEEKYLGTCIKSIMEASRFSETEVEIIVVLNRCTDSTEEVAKTFNCKIVRDDTKNLSAIRNSGVREATGEFVATVDADSRVSKNIFLEISKIFESRKYVGGGVVIFPERYSLGILCTGLMLAPIALFHRIQCGFFFFRKEAFYAINGFDENLFSAEDIDFAIRLKKYGREQGLKYSFLNRAFIITSCRKFDHFGDWYFIKNWRESFRLLRGLDKHNADKIWYDFKH